MYQQLLPIVNCASSPKGKGGTEELLHLLWEAGYKPLRERHKLCLKEVKYLGFNVSYHRGKKPYVS